MTLTRMEAIKAYSIDYKTELTMYRGVHPFRKPKRVRTDDATEREVMVVYAYRRINVQPSDLPDGESEDSQRIPGTLARIPKKNNAT